MHSRLSVDFFPSTKVDRVTNFYNHSNVLILQELGVEHF